MPVGWVEPDWFALLSVPALLLLAVLLWGVHYGRYRRPWLGRWPRIRPCSHEPDPLDVSPGCSSRCPRCGYDTRASSNRCPECGLLVAPGWMIIQAEKPELFWSWRKRQAMEVARITAARRRSLGLDEEPSNRADDNPLPEEEKRSRQESNL